MKRILCALPILALVFASSPLHAEIYRWIDGRGVVSYTDNPTSIPEQFRRKAVRMDDVPPPVEEVIVEPKQEKGSKEKGQARDGKGAGDAGPGRADARDDSDRQRDLSRAQAQLADLQSQLDAIDERLSRRDDLSRDEYRTLQNTRKVLEIRVRKAREEVETLRERVTTGSGGDGSRGGGR